MYLTNFQSPKSGKVSSISLNNNRRLAAE